MKNTLSVTLTGYEDHEDRFYPHSEQEFEVGEKVAVWSYWNNNGRDWISARKIDDNFNEEEVSKASYSDASGETHSFIAVMTVTRIFNRKMWVKQ